VNILKKRPGSYWFLVERCQLLMRLGKRMEMRLQCLIIRAHSTHLLWCILILMILQSRSRSLDLKFRTTKLNLMLLNLHLRWCCQFQRNQPKLKTMTATREIST
jgi:hypothetical protein